MSRLALAALLLAATPFAARAADPLDLVPPSSRVVVVADSPRRLAEAVTGFAAFQEAQKLAPVQALYDTANVKRAFQLLRFAEFGLGAKWPELLSSANHSDQQSATNTAAMPMNV